MSLTLWEPDQVIPAAQLNEPVDLLNNMADSNLSWASMFRRNQLQKLAVSSPQNGFYLFNTASGTPQIYISGRWYEFSLIRADYDISGQVTNTRSGSPVAGVTVTANGNQTTATDGSGNYSLSDVPKGAAVAVAGVLTGYNSYAGTVNISSGNATKNFTIARRTLSGAVTSSGGGGVSSATVSIASLGYSASTDGSGNYSLIDIPDGSYTVTATHAGHSAYSSPVAVTVSGNTVFNFTMAQLPGTVQGTVTSSVTSKQLSSIPVVIAGLSAVNTNGSGFYTQPNAPSGSRSVAVADSTYFSEYSSTVSVVASSTVTKNFTLAPKIVDMFGAGGIDAQGWPGGGVYQYFTMGNRIYISGAVQAINAVVKNCNPGSALTGTFRIYNEAGTLLVSTTSMTVMPNSTNVIALSSPTTLTAGYYRIAFYRPSGSATQLNQIHPSTSSPISIHPDISIVRTDSFYSNSDSFPNLSTGHGIVSLSIQVKR